jgi:hypothetical protein
MVQRLNRRERRLISNGQTQSPWTRNCKRFFDQRPTAGSANGTGIFTGTGTFNDTATGNGNGNGETGASFFPAAGINGL